MCGINGILDFSTEIHDLNTRIQNMNTAIAHRGPDFQDSFIDKNTGLGHVRLSILDLSDKGNQPMTSEDKRYTIVFNGEIYNYRLLQQQLANYNFVSETDTEVVLAAYIKWGEQFLTKLVGMFALAIYDAETGNTIIARDRSGIKPLYISNTQNQLIFSSEIRGVFASKLVDKKISQDALINYLRYQTVTSPNTLFEGVEMLPMGSYIIVNDENIEVKKYNDWEYNPSVVKHTVQENIHEVRNLVDGAIIKRMIADVPFGSFLSGGIDSSIVTAVAAQNSEQQLNTFSVVFDEQEFSEEKYIDEVAKKFDTNHHYLRLNSNDFLDAIPNALTAMDHPSGDGPNTYVISQETKKAGITMALSGLGGDELFAGYPIFQQAPELMAKKWLASFPKGARKLMGATLTSIKGNDIASQKKKALLALDYFDIEYIYQYSRQIFMDPMIKKMVNVKKLPENSVLRKVHELVGFEKPGYQFSPLSRISIAEMNTYMHDTLLRDADQMSMAHALEIRVPFLDQKLIDFVLQLPDQLKQGQYPKNLLVEAYKDVLPKSVYDRKKMGFVLPYDQWMKNELKQFCEDNLKELERISIFKIDTIQELWKLYLKGSKTVSWSRLWGLVVLGYKLKEWSYEE